MNENADEILIDLLIKQATEGLTDAEQAQLNKLEVGKHDASVDLTVSTISLIDEQGGEAMPSHLQASIRVSAEKYFDDIEASLAPIVSIKEEQAARPSFMGWLGWAVAAVALLALVANIYLTQIRPGKEIARGPTPTPTVAVPTLAQQRQQLMQTAPDITKASWAKGNVKEISEVSGDIVWSDSKQAGYMVLRGLPVNDRSQQEYQLWIFDETQSDKTPIDGGVFDVNENGEVIIPINAKLKAKNPKLFAITMEKPGGVVVSERGKIAALGKVET
ncbi:MAG: anti-sigma factor [Acidobacteriota bacterium]